jgi:CspA family cold shock protein
MCRTAALEEEPEPMATGTIKTIRADKGFGFIKREGGQMGGSDLFFHMSAVQGGNFDDLREGQTVSYDEERDPRDPSRFRANNVRLATAPAGDEAFESDNA